MASDATLFICSSVYSLTSKDLIAVKTAVGREGKDSGKRKGTKGKKERNTRKRTIRTAPMERLRRTQEWKNFRRANGMRAQLKKLHWGNLKKVNHFFTSLQ